MRQQHRRNVNVVVYDVTLGEARLRIKDLLQIAHFDASRPDGEFRARTHIPVDIARPWPRQTVNLAWGLAALRSSLIRAA